jgi:hypothetical protein
MHKFIWRLRAATILKLHGWRGAWSYAVALSEGDCDYYADGYSPREAIAEDHSYA